MLCGGLVSIVLALQTVSYAYEVDSAQAALPYDVASPPGGSMLHIYAPNNTNTFPVIWFATGFGMDAQVSTYSKLISKIVAKGYIVVGICHNIPRIPNYPRDGKAFHDLMEWGRGNLAKYMEGSLFRKKFVAVPDVEGRSVVMGQSAGNHVAGQALAIGCSVAKAFVMLDPVDGVDPYGIVKSEDLITPGRKLNFSIPALLLDNGLDPLTTHRGWPACAPANISNDHFYNAWVGPIWNINATAYGHVDCLDNPGLASTTCRTDPTTDKDAYRSMLANATATFLGALFENRTDDFALLENPSHFEVHVVLKHDLKGRSHAQILPGCSWHGRALEPLLV